MMDTVPKNKTVSVNFIRAVFSRFDFLTFSWNIGKELPL
jgi:hypothetical protein